MHILYPIGTFYPAQSGGPSNSVYWLAKAMVREGVRVTVVATATDQPGSTPRHCWVSSDAGRVRYVPSRFHNLPLGAIQQAWRLFPTADIVHLTSLFYPLSLVLGLLAIWQRKVVVWSPRGELAPAALATRPILKRAVLHLLARVTQAVTFHTTSPDETKQVQACFGTTARLIELPNYIDLPPRVAPPDTGQPTPYLLYLGRLHPIKALDRLLDALALSPVFGRGPWQLRLVGADTEGYGSLLRQQATDLGLADRVSFEAPVSGEAKQTLLAGAYALILPSHTENFGNVVVEALAQGTPVIASTGTPWAILPANEAGFWVPNHPTELARALDTSLSLPAATYGRYRQQASALARQQFDSTTNSYRWLSTYQALTTNTLSSQLCAE
ncbi:glycosyltransferase [Fibrivirga algicola]|uniref:Glycosyltransferase n=1 Tax=Fibrivirga algicola TaxID=2950420 RepID=A0ABX0QK02_9BACT|nr:glycosyltransferase [Fibrivirga algicola]NID12790.1 glycosyltransferase [Fibrivirga algicola]